MKRMSIRAGEAHEDETAIAALLPVGRTGSAYENLIGVLGEDLARRLVCERLSRRAREDLQATVARFLDEQDRLAGAL